jgi:RNA polymerase sigma-70 factor, ECF subfamily
MDENVLIQSAQQGDLDAFNTLILHYQDTVFNTALRILGDEDQAQDAAQEAFISAFEASTFRGGSFKAWIMRTVTNACYDELRRQKRRPTTPLEPETNDGEEMDSPKWLADTKHDSRPKSRSRRTRTCHSALPRCAPNEFRSVVVLADIQGMDYSEVAAAAHVPLGTIKAALRAHD